MLQIDIQIQSTNATANIARGVAAQSSAAVQSALAKVCRNLTIIILRW